MVKKSNSGYSKTIAPAVRNIIYADVILQDALYRDVANLSSVARSIRPALEERLNRKVNEESIISALKRLRRSGKPLGHAIQSIIAQSSVSVRTDVSKIVLDRSRTALNTVLKVISTYPDALIHLTEGSTAITLIIDEKFVQEILKGLGGIQILEKKNSLALITMHSPPAIIDTPGCILTVYSQLARSGVNIEDTTSSYTDTIIVVGLSDSGRAFESLTELITVCRRATV
ncbi:MAG: hypothetical protein QXX17_07550 [Conexivisphaerales archaeon]